MKKFLICKKCGNLVGVINDSNNQIICCGKNMETLVANTSDGALEKHVPVVKVSGNNVEVIVGEVKHPMLDEHYIMWIHIYTTLKELHFDLKPNDEPKIIFVKEDNEEILDVLAYCNLHGLWKK